MEKYSFLLSFGIVVSLALLAIRPFQILTTMYAFPKVPAWMKSHWQSSLKQKLFIRQPHWYDLALHIECQSRKEINCKFKGFKLKRTSMKWKSVRRFYKHHFVCQNGWDLLIFFLKKTYPWTPIGKMHNYYTVDWQKFLFFVQEKDLQRL